MRTPDSCSIAPLCTARCWTPHSRILPSLLPCESPPLRSINGNEKASSADSAVAIHAWAVTGFGRPATAYILPKRKKNWTTARPIISFVGAFFRPMLDALAKLLHSMVATACPDAFSGGDLFDLMRSLHEFLRLWAVETRTFSASSLPSTKTASEEPGVYF